MHLLYALWWIQSPLHACCVSATLKKKINKKRSSHKGIKRRRHLVSAAADVFGFTKQ